MTPHGDTWPLPRDDETYPLYVLCFFCIFWLCVHIDSVCNDLVTGAADLGTFLDCSPFCPTCLSPVCTVRVPRSCQIPECDIPHIVSLLPGSGPPHKVIKHGDSTSQNREPVSTLDTQWRHYCD